MDPFIPLLKKHFLAFSETFDFVKELKGYDYDLSKDIYCTKLKDSYAEFRVGNESGICDYFTVSIISNKLSISCRWESTDKAPLLATTLILRKLKK